MRARSNGDRGHKLFLLRARHRLQVHEVTLVNTVGNCRVIQSCYTLCQSAVVNQVIVIQVVALLGNHLYK